MKSHFIHGLFILLSLLALAVVMHDFTLGHTLDEVMSLEYCPICDAFHAADRVVIVLFALLMLGALVLSGAVHFSSVTLRLSLFHTLFALRAPPASR